MAQCHDQIRQQLTVSRPRETVPTNLRTDTLVVAIVDDVYADEPKCGGWLRVSMRLDESRIRKRRVKDEDGDESFGLSSGTRATAFDSSHSKQLARFCERLHHSTLVQIPIQH